MIIGLPLTADQIASIGTGINFIRLKMGGRMFYPTNMSADNSSIQSWTIQIKNNSQGGFSEGAFAGDPAEIAWSSDNQNRLTIMKGQVDGSGAKRVEGNQTDDYLTFSIKDYAEAWGTSKDIDDTVLCGYRICDPSNPGSSIVHWLAGKMGLTADQVDCGTISQVLDLVQISGTPWSNLQKLGEAYGVSVRFTGDGKLWFHSVCETGFTEPSNEWTIDADLNNLASDSHSNAIGKISSSFLKRTCTKAESSFTIYKLLSRQQIYKCTENANSSTGYCHVEVKANSTYPEEGVMELKYKDPSTGEEFAHAIEVEIPTVGITESCEIFATGELTLDYFSPDDVQGSARIRLKNSTSSAIYIKKLVLYGKPYSKQDDTKVTYELSTVPEEEKADSSVDGTFGTTSALMTTVLKRKCSIEGIRRREFSLSTWFLPQVQLGMGMQIRKAGEIISCTVASYRHSLTGKTLATLRTDLTLEEISEFVPDEDPDIIIHNPNYSLSTKGDKGDSGETPVTLYAVGSSRTSAPELSASWGSSESEWGSSEGSWGIRVEWASEAPSVPAGFYLWSKSKLPSETVWNYVCLTGEQGGQGSPGTDAVAFSIYSDKSTYRISQRNTEDQTIIFGYSIENQTGTVAWTIDASGTVSISGSVVTVLPECTLSQFTVTATLSRDGAVVDTKTITINGVVQEDVPVYLGMFTADPAASATSVAKFIRGDFYLRTDITDNGDGTFTNTATTLFPFVFDTTLTPERFRKVDSNREPRFSEICGSILADVGNFIASKPGCSSPELYVYFKTILTEYINAKTVSAMNLRLQSGGKIESSEFYWDSENNNNADTGKTSTIKRGFRYKDNGSSYTTNQNADSLQARNIRATENSYLEGKLKTDACETFDKTPAIGSAEGLDQEIESGFASPEFYQDFMEMSRNRVISNSLIGSNSFRKAAYGSGIIVICGQSGNVFGDSYPLYSSDHGITWDRCSIAARTVIWNDIAYGDGKFVMVGNCWNDDNDAIAYSSDGINWSTASDVISHSLDYVAFGNGYFIAASKDGHAIIRASSGSLTSWSVVNISANYYINGIAYGSSRFCASVAGYGILQSTDFGANWSLYSINSYGGIAICFLESSFAILDVNSKGIWQFDGSSSALTAITNWDSKLESQTDLTFLKYAGGTLVANQNSYIFQFSSDFSSIYTKSGGDVFILSCLVYIDTGWLYIGYLISSSATCAFNTYQWNISSAISYLTNLMTNLPSLGLTSEPLLLPKSCSGSFYINDTLAGTIKTIQCTEECLYIVLAVGTVYSLSNSQYMEKYGIKNLTISEIGNGVEISNIRVRKDSSGNIANNEVYAIGEQGNRFLEIHVKNVGTELDPVNTVRANIVWGAVAN